MRRATEFEVVTDTSLFTPLQLQPRVVLALAFGGLARWLRQHLVSFPRLIAEHRCSVVILGAGIDYLAPCRFFDADALSARATLKVLRQASRAQLDVEFAGRHGTVASARILLCPVRIDDPESLAATPAPFPASILEMFKPDEIETGSPERPLVALQDRIARSGEVLATARHPFAVHRHLCEVADQWAFFEVPGLIGAGREELALARGADTPLLRQAVGAPLRRVEIELGRPYFWTQNGTVETTAHRLDDRLVMVHRLLSDVPGGEQHGLAIETF
jgi:acyl-CoA thioesterase FadM